MDLSKNEVISLQSSGVDPLPKRAKRADAVANRELILVTAQKLFAEQGVANVCMAAIAEEAQLGKGTLYRSFANKGELCLALMDDDMRAFQDKTLQRLRETTAEPALVRLETFLDSLAHFMEYHARLMREVQIHGTLQHDSSFSQDSPQMWLPWLRDTIRILLQQAEQNGETHEIDIAYLIDAILAPLNANLFIYQRETLGFEVDRISRGVRHLVLHGCRTLTPTAV